MKPPKNFYSNLDRRKQGLPEVPEASATDAGKVIKVGDTGDYELGTDNSLPAVTSADNFKNLVVDSGEWRVKSNIINWGLRVVKSSNSQTFYFLGSIYTINSVIVYISNYNYPIQVVDTTNTYKGIITGIYSNTTIYARVFRNDGKAFDLEITSNNIIYKPVGSIVYYEIESSGSSVSLPSGVTFADVYAELQAGVDVKFTSGARVYSVTSFESTNIRAHWMSDLDLTSMEVYVINLASDGTGTVASATFSGS